MACDPRFAGKRAGQTVCCTRSAVTPHSWPTASGAGPSGIVVRAVAGAGRGASASASLPPEQPAIEAATASAAANRRSWPIYGHYLRFAQTRKRVRVSRSSAVVRLRLDELRHDQLDPVRPDRVVLALQSGAALVLLASRRVH